MLEVLPEFVSVIMMSSVDLSIKHFVPETRGGATRLPILCLQPGHPLPLINTSPHNAPKSFGTAKLTYFVFGDDIILSVALGCA